MEKTTLSVSDAVALVNQTLDYAFPTLVVEGEVASFKVNQGKFVFFDLKDNDCTLGCFMMVFQLRVPLEDGMRVQVVATPKLTNWGKFSLTVREVRPVGEGSLKRAFDILRAKLENEGLFAVDRKRVLPAMPERIGVISSTQAAGYKDFVKILNDRWGGMSVAVAQVQVQGVGAADQIIRAIEFFNTQEVLPEVLVLIRGGGSADDLSVFNDEKLVRALASSRVPTLVGVGHEVDTTLADLVADVRAATPSHAAQLLVADKRELVQTITHYMLTISSRLEDELQKQELVVEQYIMDAERAIGDKLREAQNNLSEQRKILLAFDPTAVLRRGYAIVRGQTRVGSCVEIEQSSQILTAEVKHVQAK